MGWKETLEDACASYNANDLETAKLKAEMALEQAGSVGGEEGAKAVKQVHLWLKQVELRMGAGGGQASGAGSSNRSFETVASTKFSNAMHVIGGLAAGIYAWFAVQGSLKGFINNLHWPRKEEFSSIDSPFDWLLRTGASVAIVWTSAWIGAGIGRVVAFIGSGMAEDLGKLADETDRKLRQQDGERTESNGGKASTVSSEPLSTSAGSVNKDESANKEPQKKYVLGLSVGLPAFVICWGIAHTIAPYDSLPIGILGGIIFGVIAESFRSIPAPVGESEEERLRRETANLQRFYKGIPLEDAWERSKLALKGNFIVDTKQWRIEGLNPREKNYLIVYQDQVIATWTDLGGCRTDTTRVVALNQSGQLRFRETANGTMITFNWLPPAFGPDDVQLVIQNGPGGDWVSVRTWIEMRCASARNGAYMFIDSYLGQPKLGGDTD